MRAAYVAQWLLHAPPAAAWLHLRANANAFMAPRAGNLSDRQQVGSKDNSRNTEGPALERSPQKHEERQPRHQPDGYGNAADPFIGGFEMCAQRRFHGARLYASLGCAQ